MPKDSPEVIRDFLLFLYPHTETNIYVGNFQKLWALADKIGCCVLRGACRKFAQGIHNTDPFLVLNWAWDNGERLLVQEASRRLLANLEYYKSFRAYKDLPPELRYLVSRLFPYCTLVRFLRASPH